MEIIKDGTIATKGQNNQMTDFVEVGDIITYTVSARNTGNVTLKDVVIKDENMKDLTGNVPTAIVTLAPSNEFTKVLEFEHLVTADEIVLGSDGKAYVYNQATATANNPNNPEEPVEVKPADNKEEARKEYSYRVEYYYDEILDDSKTESNLPANLGDIITQYTDKVIDGYKFDRVTPVDGNGNVSLPITVNENDNVIKVYYNKRTDLSYTVNYLEKDTNEVLAQPKQVGGKTYKSTVTEEAIDIEGYEKVDPTTATITIEVSGNVINFYYEKTKNLEIEKTASVTTANVGDTITYTIKVINENSTAKETTITDTLPDGITVDTSSITDGGNISSDGKQIIWPNISIPTTGKTLTYNVTVNDNMIGKTLTNNVKVSNLGEDSDSCTVEVNELNVSKTEVKPGETGKDSANIILVMDLSYSMADEDVTGSDGNKTSRINAAKDAVTQFIKKIYEDNGKPTNSKATITVITFNTKDPIHKNDVIFVTQKQLNDDYYDNYRYDHDYFRDSDNLDNNNNTVAYYIAGESEETVPYTGTSVLGNANKDNYNSLIGLVNNITLPEKNPSQPLYNQNGMGTHIRAGMDLAQTTIEQLEVSQPNNKNVVILLSDGQPSNYENNSTTDISNVVNGQNGIKNEPADFYSIGFGAEASNSSSNAYKLLAQLSSDNKVYTSNSAIELVENFTNILDEIGTKDLDTDDGVVKIDVSTQLVVSSEYPIVVKYKNNELFSFTSMDEVNNNEYGFSYNSSTKQIVWDINIWNSKTTDSEGHNITHVTSSKDTSITFYATRATNSQTGRRLLSRAMNISDGNELVFNEMVKYDEVMVLEEKTDKDDTLISSNENKENVNNTIKNEAHEVKNENVNDIEVKAEINNETEVKIKAEAKEKIEETKTEMEETEEKDAKKVVSEKEDTNSTESKEVIEKASNTVDVEVSEEPTE